MFIVKIWKYNFKSMQKKIIFNYMYFLQIIISSNLDQSLHSLVFTYYIENFPISFNILYYVIA